jgi:single-strand DNA-binding protein
MYNKVVLLGNLTRDVEIRYSQSGSAIGNVGIATSRKYKGSDGQQKDEVMFIDLTFFGRTAEIANQYLRKGSKVLVDGRLDFQQWTAQDGTKRSKHAVSVESLQMLDSKGEDVGNQGGGNYAQPQQPTYGGNQGGNSSPSYGQPQPRPQQTQTAPNTGGVPEIDMNDDEI